MPWKSEKGGSWSGRCSFLCPRS